MNRTDSWRGRIALMVAHCAGMVDLVALPVWMGCLISQYGFDAQAAGVLPTLFLAGAVLSSIFFAPRFNSISGRIAAPAAFAVAALAFVCIAGSAGDYATMAALHFVAGFATGCGLSFTHGTIGRSRNPHRLFALVGVALSVFAILFLGTMPKLVAANGGPMLFGVFAGIMAVASLVALFAFPLPDWNMKSATGGIGRLSGAVWAVIAGISCMSFVQAMTFSFLERIGSDRGFGLNAVAGVLFAIGLVNILPAPLAALLERRWPVRRVVLIGPLAQAAIALVIAQSTAFMPYAAAASVFAAVIIFTHTFAFGLLARLDPSSRAAAATPAMMMAGAALGPVLGGTLVNAAGYGSLGFAAFAVALVALFCFSRGARDLSMVPCIAVNEPVA